MTPEQTISHVLSSEPQYPKNIPLLQKILVTAHLGRLQINGVSPDNQVSLANYLFDQERCIFDFTRLSEDKKNKLNETAAR